MMAALTTHPAIFQGRRTMKRDIDLCRQLLLDIEHRGADCSLSAVKTTADHDGEPRVKHHLRLLIDAGYLKEVDRTSDGVACVRLTDAGYELIELMRSESRWHDAKQSCRELTGGTSLSVVRELLFQWAVGPVRRRAVRRYYPAPVETARQGEYRTYPPYRFEPYRDEAWHYAPEEVRYVRLRPDQRNGWREVSGYPAAEFAVAESAPTLPEHII